MKAASQPRPSASIRLLHAIPLGRDLTEKLLSIAALYHDETGGCHDLDHSCRVHNTALHIGRAMAADQRILSAASILHDIGRRFETEKKGRICHALKGAELARTILADFDFSKTMIDAIAHCIASHRYRNEHVPATLEARILFDADKIDSIGATGIGRAFLFAGQVGARLHNPGEDIDGTEPYSSEDTAYREFSVKLRRIKDRMQTPAGRRLAMERHEFMERFFDRLRREMRGEYRDESR